MSNIKKAKKCAECGALLQGDDANRRGFIDQEILTNDQYKILYCNECFDKKLENQDSFFDLPVNPGFYNIINDAMATDSLILYVIDLFSFEDSFNKELDDTLSENKANVVVVGAKRDLLPENIDEQHLLDMVQQHVARGHLAPRHIVIGEIKDSKRRLELLEMLEKARKGHDVYVIGPRYAGKSSLVTTFLSNYKNPTKRQVVTENYPSTSLRVTEIPLDASASAYDTPGLSIANSILSKVERAILNRIRPRKRVSSRKNRLFEGGSLYLGGLFRLDLIKGKPLDLSTYVSHDIEVKMRPKINGKTDYFFKAVNKGGLEPCSRNFTSIDDFDVYDIQLDNDNKAVDLTICGLGWISLNQNGQTIKLYVPSGVSINLSDTRIKYVKPNK